MKGMMLATGSSLLLAVGLADVPSFDWHSALVVGAVVTVVAAVIIAGAIVTPFVAVQAGATILGTCLAIGAISLTTGVAAGVVAGFTRGAANDKIWREEVDKIVRVSNWLDLSFEPDPNNPDRAAEFRCALHSVEETDLQSRPPKGTKRSTQIRADSGSDFYQEVEQKMRSWFETTVGGDKEGRSRKVRIFMKPYPGDGVYDRLRNLAEKHGGPRCEVSRIEAPRTSSEP